MVKFLRLYQCDVKGATAIEYALIAAGIAVAIMAVVYAFGDDVASLYDGLAGALDG